MNNGTPKTETIGIDHLTATEREYKLRNLARELEHENVRLRAALEKYRGQLDNEGKHSAADALASA